MASLRQRRYVLAGLLALTALLAAVLLFEVLGTVFFAITVAYVLLPVRRSLVARGLGRRIASALATLLAFVFVLAVVGPLLFVLYRRRYTVIDLLQAIPGSLDVELFGFTYTVDVAAYLDLLREAIGDLAVDVAQLAPVLALKLTLFVFVVYALLLKPEAVRTGAFGLVPPEYHDVVMALHRRVRETLYALYVLQVATSVGTFLTGLVVFLVLGYEGAVALAVIGGILQFIPIVGPSLLVAVLAASDLLFGDPTRAVAVVVLGAVFVGFLPDAVIRPRLARSTVGLPVSVYFIGFTGGVLSVGVVGLIAGPLVVALLVELVELLSETPSGAGGG